MWVPWGTPQTPTGAILAFAGAAVPSGWLICDGTAVSRVTFAALFGILGTAYGAGDGINTFNLPNLRGRVPVGLDGTAEFNALGAVGGEKAHTLTEPEVPAHNHFETHAHTVPMSDQVGVQGAGISSAIQAGGFTATSVVSTGNVVVGGNGDHNNLQPYLTLNFIIKT